MKKVLLVLALVVTTGALFTSCKSTHSCPAYGKVHQQPAGESC
jgi:hypothetical protein